MQENRFQERRVTPPLPAGRSAFVEPELSPIARLVERDHSSGFATYIEYKNSKGERSERRIVCKSITLGRGGTTIGALCIESDAFKTFRLDRITNMVDIETGELVDPVEVFAQLQMCGALKTTDHALRDLASLFVFMAKCDGEYHPLEEAAIHDAIDSYCLRFGGSTAMAEDVQFGCGKLAPDGSDMIVLLDNLGKHHNGKALARFALDRCGKVIDADGVHPDDEFTWAMDLQGRLRKIADAV